MRVHVVADQCEANGVCEGLVPEVFGLGERDEVEILEDPVQSDHLSPVADAVASCPKAALRLSDD